MNLKTESDTLKETIVFLQDKQAQELSVLREQFYTTYESIKPINLLKNAIDEITTSGEIKNNLIANVIGLATGYISKKVIIGASHNPVKNIFGTLLQFAIANVVSKHSETIKSTVGNILQRIFKNRNETDQEYSTNIVVKGSFLQDS